jgi:hypothetical protein
MNATQRIGLVVALRVVTGTQVPGNASAGGLSTLASKGAAAP